jgi:hypothetical protein
MIMVDEADREAINAQLLKYDAEEQSHLLLYKEAKRYKDTDGMAEASDRRDAYIRRCNQVIAQSQPRQPEQLSQEEINARPWDKMTPQNGLDLAKTSKYGRDLSFRDPHVIAGWHEANRRRARGE